MLEGRKKNIVLILAILLFIIAGLLQYIDSYFSSYGKLLCSYCAEVIFFILIIAWAISINMRMIQKRIRNNLIVVCMLLLLWLLIRIIKYKLFEVDDIINRYLWYAYYVPELMIPPLVFISVLGIERNKPISKMLYLIFIPAIILIGFIFTNDLHQLVFSFEPGFNNFSSSYKHEILFYVAMIWMIGMTIAWGVVLFLKCSISGCKRKIWIPSLVFVSCTVISIVSFVYNLRIYNIPELLCFSFIAIFESFIEIGLIPSNDNYSTYFKNTMLSVEITDESLNPIYRSNKLVPTSKQVLEKAIKEEVLLDDDTRIKTNKIAGGRVFWIEDIKSINELNAELKDINEILSEEKDLVLYENELKEKSVRLKQKNKLYENIRTSIIKELELVKKYIDNAKKGEDYKKNLQYASVLVAYIKRRSNLAVISEKQELIDIEEINLSFNESLRYIKNCGIKVEYSIKAEGEKPSSICILLYEIFEDYINYNIEVLQSLIVDITSIDGKIEMQIHSNIKTFFPSERIISEIESNDGLIFKNISGCFDKIVFDLKEGK